MSVAKKRGLGRGLEALLGPKAAAEAPALEAVDGDTLREFRLLVEGVMDRIEERARERAAWWAEERTRARRVELLRPYNLRFHLGTDDTIQIILFNGRYAEYHRGFVQGNLNHVAAPLEFRSRPSEIHQDPSHQLRGHREEVRPVLPSDAAGVDQT